MAEQDETVDVSDVTIKLLAIDPALVWDEQRVETEMRAQVAAYLDLYLEFAEVEKASVAPLLEYATDMFLHGHPLDQLASHLRISIKATGEFLDEHEFAMTGDLMLPYTHAVLRRLGVICRAVETALDGLGKADPTCVGVLNLAPNLDEEILDTALRYIGLTMLPFLGSALKICADSITLTM